MASAPDPRRGAVRAGAAGATSPLSAAHAVPPDARELITHLEVGAFEPPRTGRPWLGGAASGPRSALPELVLVREPWPGRPDLEGLRLGSAQPTRRTRHDHGSRRLGPRQRDDLVPDPRGHHHAGATAARADPRARGCDAAAPDPRSTVLANETNSTSAPPLTPKMRLCNAHPHFHVVPCWWQRGGPITLATDTRRVISGCASPSWRSGELLGQQVDELLGHVELLS